MRDTCCDKCRNTECPNKIESYWKDEKGELKILTDCAPKRSMLMLQDFSNQIVSQQAAIEQLRNEQTEIKAQLIASNERFVQAADQMHQLLNVAQHLIQGS